MKEFNNIEEIESSVRNIVEGIIENKEDDIGYDKNKIMTDLLYGAPEILYVLNNPSLNPLEDQDLYRNVNIFSHINIPDIQSTSSNFICFEVDDVNESYFNDIMLNKVITFMIIVHEKNIETQWGIDRHDLLAALIKKRFNWSNYLGMHLKKVYDSAGIMDNGYYFRTIKFKTTNTNGNTYSPMKR